MKITRLWMAHVCMFLAELTWGLMAPIGKDAMTHGFSGMNMVVMRTAGGAACFWLLALVTGDRERVARRDLALLALAAMLAIVANQCCFTVGLSLTSPVNASIVTTSMPIFTLLIALLAGRERLGWRKVAGIALGITGAVSLILNSSTGQADMPAGDIRGDLLCMTAQLSFATYLALFGRLISRYRTTTCMKWMFLFAALVCVPLDLHELREMDYAAIAPRYWAEAAFVVLGATFVAYLLMMRAQKVLTPTQVSVYNYVQPVVSATGAILMGVASIGWLHALAIACIFGGVRLVTRKI